MSANTCATVITVCTTRKAFLIQERNTQDLVNPNQRAYSARAQIDFADIGNRISAEKCSRRSAKVFPWFLREYSFPANFPLIGKFSTEQ